MSMAGEPDRRSNFFFIPPAHLCAVAYMTEISLIVMLNNQFTLPLPYYLFICQVNISFDVLGKNPYFPPRAHVAKFYGRFRLIRSVLKVSTFPCLKFIHCSYGKNIITVIN